MRVISIIILSGVLFISPVFSQNLLKNPGMEASNSSPTEWRLDEFRKDGTTVKIEQWDAHGGNNYVTLENREDNDARLIQTVKIEDNTKYRVSGWIKTENVSQEGIGANLSLNEHWFISREIKGTNNKWEYVEFYLSATKGLSTVTVCLRLGGYGGTSTGKASFDDISMVKVDKVPGGDRTFTIGRADKDDSRETENTATSTEESITGTDTEQKSPVDQREPVTNVIVYSLILLSIIVFCIQLIIVKPPKPENKEG